MQYSAFGHCSRLYVNIFRVFVSMLNAACNVPNAKKYGSGCDLLSCNTGWTVSLNKTECIPNKCLCPNGSASLGAKCPRDGDDRCDSCNPGLALNSNHTACHSAAAARSRKTVLCVEFTEIKHGNWQLVPGGAQSTPCFHRLSTEEKVTKGATVIIEARVKAGKATVFIGTASNLRQQYAKKFVLDVAGCNHNKYERTMFETSTIYIGVDIAHSNTECEIKYEYMMLETTKTTAAVTTTAAATKKGAIFSVIPPA